MRMGVVFLGAQLVLAGALSGCGEPEGNSRRDSGEGDGAVDVWRGEVLSDLTAVESWELWAPDLNASDHPDAQSVSDVFELWSLDSGPDLADAPGDLPLSKDNSETFLDAGGGEEAVAPICTPGEKACLDDNVLLVCNVEGKELEFFASCWDDGFGHVCHNGDCIDACDLATEKQSYLGCEFWAADLDNAFVPGGRSGFYDAAGAQYTVIVSNSHHQWAASVEIHDSDGPVLANGVPLSSAPIPPGEAKIYNLPRRDVDGTVVGSLAYRVTSTIPVSVYQFNPLENVDVFSNDASLILPSSAAGKLFYVMTREQSFESLRSFFTVIGIEESTTVTVEVTAFTLAGVNQLNGEALKALAPGESMEVKLGPYDVLNVETDEIGGDLTGSLITATKPVAVFGGREAANAPNTDHCIDGVCEWDGATPCTDNGDCNMAGFNTCCADHLEQQLLPVDRWGTGYLAAKTYPRGQEKDIYRLIAAQDGTEIHTEPAQAPPFILNAGEWTEFESDADFMIVASHPIMVGQFIPGEDAPDPNPMGLPQAGDAGIGDPAFILLVPSQQFRNDYVFVAPDKYALDYVTIVAPAGVQVWLDCPDVVPLEIQQNCVPIEAGEFQPFGDGQYAAAKLVVEDGVHRVYAAQPAGVYVYGYDQYVSYGYPAGMNSGDLGLYD